MNPTSDTSHCSKHNVKLRKHSCYVHSCRFDHTTPIRCSMISIFNWSKPRVNERNCIVICMVVFIPQYAIIVGVFIQNIQPMLTCHKSPVLYMFIRTILSYLHMMQFLRISPWSVQTRTEKTICTSIQFFAYLIQHTNKKGCAASVPHSSEYACVCPLSQKGCPYIKFIARIECMLCLMSEHLYVRIALLYWWTPNVRSNHEKKRLAHATHTGENACMFISVFLWMDVGTSTVVIGKRTYTKGQNAVAVVVVVIVGCRCCDQTW